MEGKINSSRLTRILNIWCTQYTYQWYLKKNKNKCRPTAKTIHILFQEQAVCGLWVKYEKSYLIIEGKIIRYFYNFNVSIVEV